MQHTPPANYIATISNALVTATYSCSIVEKKLLLYAIGSINTKFNYTKTVVDENVRIHCLPEDTSLEVNTLQGISISKYAKTYNLEPRQARHYLASILNTMYKAEVHIHEGTKNLRTRWISAIITDTNEPDMIYVRWSVDILPYIYQLRDNFTSFRLKFLRELDSVYAIRLYEILLSALNKSKRSNIQFDLYYSEIRAMFDLGMKYSSNNDLFKRVIKAPLLEIRESTDLDVGLLGEDGKVNYIKEGRKVLGVRVKVRKSKPKSKVLVKNGTSAEEFVKQLNK